MSWIEGHTYKFNEVHLFTCKWVIHPQCFLAYLDKIELKWLLKKNYYFTISCSLMNKSNNKLLNSSSNLDPFFDIFTVEWLCTPHIPSHLFWSPCNSRSFWNATLIYLSSIGFWDLNIGKQLLFMKSNQSIWKTKRF